MGGESGPDLTRSALVAEDVRGDKIGPVVRAGRVDKGMPAFTLGDADLAAVVAFIHDQKTKAASLTGGRRGVDVADLQTGNADAGKQYFDGAVREVPLANRRPRRASPRGCRDCAAAAHAVSRRRPAGRRRRAKVTVTTRRPARSSPARSPIATSSRSRSPMRPAGIASWPTHQVTFTVDDPLQAHVEQLGKYTDDDMHNVLAYLQTLR